MVIYRPELTAYTRLYSVIFTVFGRAEEILNLVTVRLAKKRTESSRKFCWSEGSFAHRERLPAKTWALKVRESLIIRSGKRHGNLEFVFFASTYVPPVNFIFGTISSIILSLLLKFRFGDVLIRTIWGCVSRIGGQMENREAISPN